MELVLETTGLTKSFDGVLALDHKNLQIPSHSIVGLLGRNGSGKTTLFNHLMGLQLPTEGSASTLGVPAATLDHQQLVQIGFVPQETRLLDWMTVDQHLRYVSSFYPDWGFCFSVSASRKRSSPPMSTLPSSPPLPSRPSRAGWVAPSSRSSRGAPSPGRCPRQTGESPPGSWSPVSSFRASSPGQLPSPR